MKRRVFVTAALAATAGCATETDDDTNTTEADARFEVTTLNVVDALEQGTVGTFDATIRNVGDRHGEQQVRAVVDDTTIFGEAISLNADDSTTINGEFGTNHLSLGTTELTVHTDADNSSSTFTVEDPYDYTAFADRLGDELDNVLLIVSTSYNEDSDYIYVGYPSTSTTPSGLRDEMAAVSTVYLATVKVEHDENGMQPKRMEATIHDTDGNPTLFYHIKEDWVRQWLNDEMSAETVGSNVIETLV